MNDIDGIVSDLLDSYTSTEKIIILLRNQNPFRTDIFISMLLSAKAVISYNMFTLLYPSDAILTVDLPQESFFEEVCVNVIAADKKIKFAGIVDSEGKLFFGKHRPNHNNKERSFVVEPSSFYIRYLIPAIHKIEKIPKGFQNATAKKRKEISSQSEKLFGLVNLCNGSIRLIVIPIEEDIKKRYLCIFILK